MSEGRPARGYDQTAIRRLRKGRDRAFDFIGVAFIKRVDLHPKHWRHRLNDAELSRTGGRTGIAKDRHTRVTPGAICLSSSSHFPLMLYSNSMKPVALRPGRARLSTKPPATGSAMIGNTIGTVRVASINGPTVEVP